MRQPMKKSAPTRDWNPAVTRETFERTEGGDLIGKKLTANGRLDLEVHAADDDPNDDRENVVHELQNILVS